MAGSLRLGKILGIEIRIHYSWFLIFAVVSFFIYKDFQDWGYGFGASLLMGLAATYFSRSDDGLRREMLCLNVNFSFKAPIRAETEVDMRWVVSALEHNRRLGGWVGQLNGNAFSGGTDCVIARATVLVKRLD